MIHQKDWLMRQIESMIAAVLYFLTHISTGERTRSDQKYEDLIDSFLDNGDICGAEDWLYEKMDSADIQWLFLSVGFYKKLNMYSDEYLEAHNFSRDEISSGLKYVTDQYGYGHIL